MAESANSISTVDYRNYITIEPNKRGGKPCVRGLRITVYEVLEYLASEIYLELQKPSMTVTI